MTNILNTYSSSFKYDLEQFFTCNDENIQNFLSVNISDILNKNNEIKKNLYNYSKLKTFLGKKRNRKLNEDDYLTNKKYFNKSISIDNINEISVDLDDNQNIYVDKKGINESIKLQIFQRPMLLIQLYDSQSINIDLINDSLYLKNKVDYLNKYEYQIYSIENNENDLNKSNQIKLPQIYDKAIEIENEIIYPYLIVINSPIPKISNSDLLLKNIYKSNEEKNGLISPKNISKIFFCYFRINNELQQNYQYIESDNRKKLYNILSQFLLYSPRKITVIVGPKGIGKTTSLIKFSFQKRYRTFYFNLESYHINPKHIKIYELKIQLGKLFGEIEDIEKKEKEKNIKKQIESYIENNTHKNCFEFIFNVISIFKDFTKKVQGVNFGFIIDQYSKKYDNDKEYNLDMITSLILYKTEDIKLILCPTINNIYSKEQINTIFSKSLNADNRYFDIFFFQEFISKEKFMEHIIQNESDDYKNIMDELGHSPKFYYELNSTDVKSYKEYLSTNIRKNIEEYFLSDNTNKYENINMITGILNLLDIVKNEKLISSCEIKKNIEKFPFKYLRITKYKINKEIIQKISKKIDDYYKENKDKKKEDILEKYIKLLWDHEENYKFDKIIEKQFFIEEKDILLYTDNYLERNEYQKNIYGNYYETFIDNYNNFFDPSNHKYNHMYLYRLNFSLNLIENVFLEYLYDHVKKENLIFSKILDKGAIGGFFELLLGYYIQKGGVFLGETMEQTIYIPSLVPNNYSIKFYSYYNQTPNKFKEFKLDKNAKKKNIAFKNTFIKQIIFNSKYYDMAILIKTDEPNKYKLIVIQATIKKDKNKRMTKEEHELILRSVKMNLENEYNIVIEEAYFIYVLSKKNGKIEDQETKKDCLSKKIEYIGFDIDNFNEVSDYKINLENAFITKTFPLHNSSSLLSFTNNGEDKKFIKLKKIIDEKINSSKALKNYFDYIEKLFKNKYDDKKLSLEQFHYFELSYSTFDKNREVLNHLSDFSFLVFIENKGEKIYIHFNKITYDCKNENNKYTNKLMKKDCKLILFSYSSVPLTINNNA